MSRCGPCSSAGASGAAVLDSDCITWTGAGTVGDPFVAEPIVDPDATNLLECGASGLLVPDPDNPGSWTSYTPVWNTTGGAPSIGNGSLLGRYRARGKSLEIGINLVIGSTTSIGTGEWQLSLPGGFTSSSAINQVVATWVNSATANVGFTGLAYFAPGSTVTTAIRVTGLGDVGGVASLGSFPVSDTQPPYDAAGTTVTWGAGDFIAIGAGVLLVD